MALILIIIFINSSLIFSQSKERKFFVSIHSGIHHTFLNAFEKSYESKNLFLKGFTAGIKSSKDLYFFIKVSYSEKRGVPEFKKFVWENNQSVYLGTNKEGNAGFTQLFIDEGFIYFFFENLSWKLSINGGINYSMVSEKIISNYGYTVSNTDAT